MIHSPSLLPRNVVNSNWLHVTDWYPTILSMAGLTSSQSELDGIDHWSHLQNPDTPDSRLEMIYNIYYPTFAFDNSIPIAAIRVGPWKYIKRTIGFNGYTPCPSEVCSNYTSPPAGVQDVQNELYNLENDPTESLNLIDEMLEVAEDLKLRLEQYIAALPDELYPDEDEAGDPANFGGVWSDGWC